MTRYFVGELMEALLTLVRRLREASAR